MASDPDVSAAVCRKMIFAGLPIACERQYPKTQVIAKDAAELCKLSPRKRWLSTGVVHPSHCMSELNEVFLFHSCKNDGNNVSSVIAEQSLEFSRCFHWSLWRGNLLCREFEQIKLVHRWDGTKELKMFLARVCLGKDHVQKSQ